MQKPSANISLNIAVVVNPPSVASCFFNSTSCPKPGISIEMTKLLCRAMRYNCTFSWAGTDQYGYLENGTWHGAVGYIKDGLFDLGVPRFAPTSDRLSVVDFSEGYFFDGTLLIAKNPSLIGRTESLDLFGGFRWQVWLCIASLMSLASQLLADTLIVRRKKSFVETFLGKYFSKFFFHCHRLCLVLISLTALILLRSYTGYIFSQDVVLSTKPPFQDLKSFVECLEKSKCRLAAPTPGVGYLKDVLNSNNGTLYKRLRTAVLVNRPYLVTATNRDLLTSILEDNTNSLIGFISELDFYYEAKLGHCNFYKLSTVFPTGPRSIPVPKKSPLLRDLDRMARLFRESGITKKIMADYYRLEEDNCPKPKHTLHAASLGFLVNVFIFYGAGTALACLAFLGEKLFSNVRTAMRYFLRE